MRLASGLLIVLIGLQVAFNWRILAPLESAGARLWRWIAPTAKGLLPVETGAQALALGLVWGFLPCGLVYSVLLLAASTADPVGGSLVMLSFGLGTMPAMIATGLSASKLSQFMSRRRLGAGLLIVLIGLATIAMPVLKLSASQDHSMHRPSGLVDTGTIHPRFEHADVLDPVHLYRARILVEDDEVGELPGFETADFVLRIQLPRSL